MLCVRVQKSTDHALILRVVLLRFALEEVDASLAQCERYLHSIVSKYKVFRWREEIRDNLGFP
jgi:hypothetical protein